MPNFDFGHYFLSTLAPIRVGSPADLPEEKQKHYMNDFEGDLTVSFEQRVQRALSDMATALQSPATQAIGINSPFSKSLRTHLCRYVIINDTVYNGRRPTDALLNPGDPLKPQHVDALPCPYLMWAVDFDAVKEPGDKLPDELTDAQQDDIRDHYLEAVWREGSAELMEIYKNCQDFDPDTIKSPKDFAAYIQRCQIETWMSYNDYYLELPKVPELSLSGTIWKLIIGVGAPLIVSIVGLIAWLTGNPTVFDISSGWLAIGGLLVAIVLGWLIIHFTYKWIIKTGMTAWPAPKHGDLPSVLKGLYVQQKFSDFVVANQGKTDKQLHTAFGKFLTAHKPEDVLDPATTQPPGVIKS